jgi:hypothetical protein
VDLRRWSIGVLFPSSVHAQPLKNVQILTGLSRPEIWNVMNQMRAGLGEALRQEIVAEIIPLARQKKIARYFGEKLTLLSESGQLPIATARALRHPDHSADARTREHSADAALSKRDR